MADVNANIGVHIDTSSALAELKNLQRQLATFHSSIAQGTSAAAAAQKNLQTNLLNSINSTGMFTARMGLVRTSTESFTHALETNKLTMREYFRYAGASTKTFGRLFKSEFDTIGKVAQERVRKMQTQYIKMGRDANGAMKAMAITPNTLNMKDYATQTAVAAQKQALFNQLMRQGSTNLLNFGKNTQWAGRQLMVGFSVPLAYIGSFAAKTFMELEAQAIRFKRVYGDMLTSSGETDKALADIQKLAEGFTKYGVAVVDTMKMAADAAAMGKMGADLTAQVAEATRLAVLGGVEQQKALETTISLTNSFGIAAEDLKNNIDFLNAVENQTVVSIEDLTTAIPKAGPVIQQLGGDVKDLAFFLTAMKEGGINASEGANAIKSGLASLINPTKKASEMLAGMGINIKAIVESNAGDIKGTVVQFARALDTLDPLNRARAIEQLFGKFQFARLSTLFQNITKDGTQAAKVLDLAGRSVEELAILSEREMKTVEDAVGVNFKESVQKLKVAIAPIGKTFLEAITPVITAIGKLFDKFNNLGDGTKKFIVVATTLVGVIGPILLMTFGLLANGLANILKLFLALRTGFMKIGSSSTNLAEQTTYLNAAQLEAATVAASLNQAHTQLTQKFEFEAAAVRALRTAYIEATVAASAFARTNPGMMVGGKPGVPRKFATGSTEVPGIGNKDTVPSLLTPGEAVIPKGIAQDPQFKPIISAMVNGTIRKYGTGTGDVRPSNIFGPNAQKFEGVAISPTGGVSARGTIGRWGTPLPGGDVPQSLPASNVPGRDVVSDKTVFAHATDKRTLVGQDVPADLRARGYKKSNAYTGLGFDIPEELHKQLTHNKANVREYENALRQPGAVKTMTARLIEQGFSVADAKRSTNAIRKNLIKSLIDIPTNVPIGDSHIYSRMGNSKTGILGGLIKRSEGGTTAKAIAEILKPAVYGVGGKPTTEFNSKKSVSEVIDAVKKTKTKESTINALERLKKADPSRMLDVRIENGEITAFRRNEVSRTTGEISTKTNDGVLVNGKFVGGRSEGSSGGVKVTAKTAARRKAVAALEGLTATDMQGREVTTYSKQISEGSGFSNKDARHLSGIYETADGSRVFVKPMLDEKLALAEMRGTAIAREVHGLEAPVQSLKVIKDPLTGEKMFALESKFDPKFDPATMTNTFKEGDYFKQLVASMLRGDKDLRKGNLSGSLLPDVGTAGVFETASGAREYSKNIKSMLEQGKINLGGVPGSGAMSFFHMATQDIPKSMTADQYHAKMMAEIDTALPKLEKTIAGFNLTAEEKPFYDAMIQRLRDAKGVNWRELYAIHSDKNRGKKAPVKKTSKPAEVLIQKGEVLQDNKTGKIEKPKPSAKPTNVKPSSGKSKDNIYVKVPKNKSVVKVPRIIPGKDSAPFINPYLNSGMTPEQIATAKSIKRNRGTQGSSSAYKDSGMSQKEITQARATRKLEEAKNKQLAITNRLQKDEVRAQEMRTKLLNQSGKVLKDGVAVTDKSNRANLLAGKNMTQVAGRANMAMGGLTGLAIAASFAGGKTGEMAQAVMPFVFGLQGLTTLLSMGMGPLGWTVVGIAALGAVIWKMNSDLEKARQKGVAFGKAMSMGTDKIIALSKITGTVSASEEAARRRSDTLAGGTAVQRKTGQTILESEYGKSLQADIQTQVENGLDSKAIAKNVAKNLSYAVIQGVITTDQAKSISMALGDKLKNYEIPAMVSGKIVSLLGPNGENLVVDPLNVILNVQKESFTNVQEGFKTALDSTISEYTATNLGAYALGIGTMITGVAMAVGASAATLASGGLAAPSFIPAFATYGAGVAITTGAEADKNKRKSKNIELSAAAVQLGIEEVAQNQGLIDSLNKQYDIKLKTAKTSAEIKDIEDKRKAAVDQVAAKNKESLDYLISQKDTLGNDVFNKAMEAEVNARYKDAGAIKAFADQALKDIKGMQDSKLKTTLQLDFASGTLDPLAVSKIVSMAASNKDFASSFDLLVKTSGSTAEAGFIVQLLMKAGTTDTTMPIIIEFLNKKDGTPIKKKEDALSWLGDMYTKYGIVVDINKNGITKINNVMSIMDKLKGDAKTPITKQIITEALAANPGDPNLTEILAQWDGITQGKDTVKKQVLIDFIAAGDTNVIDAYLSDQGIPRLKGRGAASQRKYYDLASKTWLVTGQGKNLDPYNTAGDPNGNETTDTRDTTYDDILNTLKRTRDATIKATGGAKELMRILGGKKELQFFNGLDQQLAKLGANTDFIDWVGGIDDAIRNKLITVTKKGIAALTELGKATKKAFDAKQLGLFSVASINAAQAAKDQRISFLKLTSAGISTADAIEITSDASLASAIAQQKDVKVIKQLVAQQKAKRQQEELTLALTDPKQYMSDVNDELQRQYDLQQKLMGLQQDATEAKIRGNYIGAALIGQQQRQAQFDSNANANPVDINAKLGVMQQALKAAGSSSQANLIKSTLGQYSMGVNNLRMASPNIPGANMFQGGNFGYSGVNQSYGQAQANGIVYNITTNVNVDNADAKAIADLATKQTIAQIKLIGNKNNKTNGVAK